MGCPGERVHQDLPTNFPLTATSTVTLNANGIRTKGARHGVGRWRGQTTVAPHQRQSEASRAFWRNLPNHRFRAVKLCECALPENCRPYAIQKPQSRPPHFSDLALLHPARQLRDPRASTDATRPTMVSRLSRCDLSKPQPHLRRATRLCRSVRSRSHLSDGSAPNGRPAHRLWSRCHRGRNSCRT